jgi:hypothetical protein
MRPGAKTCITDVGRYRIAQLFHELSPDLGEAATLELLSHQYRISAEDVLSFAAEFRSEPLWRL